MPSQKVLTHHPLSLHTQLEEIRLTRASLETLSIFKEAGLNERSRQRLAESVVHHHLQIGETLVNAGEVRDFLVLVAGGEISVYARDVFKETSANTTADASVDFNVKTAFLLEDHDEGAQYLFDPAPATHTLQANRRSVVLTLDSAAFDQFALEDPSSALRLQSLLSRRLVSEMKKAQTNLRLLFETLKSVG